MTNEVRTTYRELTESEKHLIEQVKWLGQGFIDLMNQQESCREFSLACTKIEEAIMWATKGVTA